MKINVKIGKTQTNQLILPTETSSRIKSLEWSAL